jgi:hypothetical protein
VEVVELTKEAEKELRETAGKAGYREVRKDPDRIEREYLVRRIPAGPRGAITVRWSWYGQAGPLSSDSREAEEKKLRDEEARDRVRRFIDIGRATARLVAAVEVGGLAEAGWFVGPHLFTDVDPGGPLGQEEIFGPVLAVLRARDFEHAIDLANGTPYALTAGVYSRSPSRLERAREALEAGNVYLNRGITGALVHRQPFGGYRLSGIGSKAGGPDYLGQFTVPRTVTENTLRRGFAPPPAASGGTHETLTLDR